MLAGICANMRSLSCSNLILEVSMAQTCLRVLPPGVPSLELYVPAAIVHDVAWGRLGCLEVLQLNFPPSPTVHLR